MESSPSNNQEPRDATFWAQRITELKVTRVPTGALNLNVDGLQLAGPLQGFGQMWQKTYRIELQGASVTPAEIIKTWKQNFPRYWPAGNYFYGPLTGIAPGEVALLNLAVARGMILSTGVLVIYADDECFTLMTPQGHMFAGWITFSAFEENGCPVVQVQVLIRASDPLYEIALRLGAHKKEDVFWQRTLQALAADFGVHQPVLIDIVCVDPRIQWSEARNIWRNAAVRTTLYRFSSPVRQLSSRFQRRPPQP